MNKIGIILEEAVLRRGALGKPTYEKLEFYEEMGKELALKPVFFHPKEVNIRTRTLNGYVWSGKKLVQSKARLPEVIHNRLLSGDAAINNIIRQLSRVCKVYNGVAIRNKVTVQNILWENEALRSHLPETARYNRETLIRFMQLYPILYVKPLIGSIGRGVLRIEKVGKKWRLTSAKSVKLVHSHAVRSEIDDWVDRRRFLVQQGIALATFDGQTFDIRVSVQKNEHHDWVVSGMVAKIANPANKLSNLAQGGEAMALPLILNKLFPQEKVQQVKEEIASVALQIVKQYESAQPDTADLGLDIGITGEGKPHLIEVNVRDQRYSFFKAGELEMFRQTYWNPLAFGKTLFDEN